MRYCSHCHASYSAEERFCPLDGGAIVDEGNADHPLVGRTLGGRYLIRRRIGKGGMGEVFEADHIGLDKRVALKFLLDKFNTDREVLTRFHREARTASRIGHVNIVDITDIGETDDGKAYIVMELLSGQDLGHALRRGPMHLHRAVHIVRQICRGLAAAHDKGIVHRDMKPENVFLTQRDDQLDVVKIMDFGISKVIDAHDSKVRLTQTGAVVGTPIYMAPEQAMASNEVDHRADVYAVGVMLFELVCGRPPFEGTSYLQLVTQHINSDPPRPAELRADVPRALEALILDALAKEPAMRPPTMRAFEQRLPAVPQLTPSMVDGPQPIATRSPQPAAYAAPTAMPTRTFQRNLRTPMVLVGLAAAAAAGMIAFGYFSGRGGSDGSSESAQQAAAATPPPPAPATAADAGVVAEPLPRETGSIEIDSLPRGADVFFDGGRRGVTPVTIDDVAPGVHLIRLESDDHAPLQAQKQVRTGYEETFFGALAPKRSGRRSKVRATKPNSEPTPPKPGKPGGPSPLTVIDPDTTMRPTGKPKPAPGGEPAPADKPKPKPGDSDHKPNPFDDRKSNPFAD
jgi:serine/threonine-protein kinase